VRVVFEQTCVNALTSFTGIEVEDFQPKLRAAMWSGKQSTK
jgi:hypothetical protein